MVLVAAYREQVCQLNTPRTRCRNSMRRELAFADLKVGMRVRVKEDAAFVELQCDDQTEAVEQLAGTEPVGWDPLMARACGKVYEVLVVQQDFLGADLHTSIDPCFQGEQSHGEYTFPYTAHEFEKGQPRKCVT